MASQIDTSPDLSLHRRVKKVTIKGSDTQPDSHGLTDDGGAPPPRQMRVSDIRVQEADGSFFENFTVLQWKQENRRLRAVQSDASQETSGSLPTESRVGIKCPRHELKGKEFELLYIEVLYTVKHKIGTSQSGLGQGLHPDDLHDYARQAFGVSEEQHRRLMDIARHEKPPIVVLNVVVVAAKNLEAKDANGLSDPYCMLGICPGSAMLDDQRHNGDSPTSLSSELHEGRSEKKGLANRFTGSLRKTLKRDRTPDRSAKEQVPAKYIQVTDVRRETLNPRWNEKFRFDIEDCEADTFHLDIWDHDDETSVSEAVRKLNEVASFKGMGRYFKQIAQSARRSGSSSVDDFLGSINVNVKGVPSVGLDRWFDLEGRSGRSSVRGQIHLRVKLGTREDRGVSEEDNWTELKQHKDLICVFIANEMRKKARESPYAWDGELPKVAHAILHQHAIQGDVTEMQQAACKWEAYLTKHVEHCINYAHLLSLLDNLESLYEPEALSRDEIESLTDSFERFKTLCFESLKRLRELFPAQNTAAIEKLENLLRCLTKLYSMAVFKRCFPFTKELPSELSKIVRQSTQDWYDDIKEHCKPPLREDEDVIQDSISLVNTINVEGCKSAINFYGPAFTKACNFDYFSMFFRTLEKSLCPDLRMALEELQESGSSEDVVKDDANPITMQMGTAMFELYMALQALVKTGVDHLPSNERKGLTVTRYHEWFKSSVSRWLNIAKHKSKLRIKKAIELDKIQQVDNLVKWSTSSVDATTCFAQIKEFWKQLAWPDLVDSFVLVMQVMNDIAEGSLFYAESIEEKLRTYGYFNDTAQQDGSFGQLKQLDVTQELCISINNLEQVRKSVRQMPEQLNVCEIAAAMEKTHGLDASKQCQATFNNIVKGADDELQAKINDIVKRVAAKMRQDIKKHIFHLAWAPEGVIIDEAIDPLMSYLDKSLVTLNMNLMKLNFTRMLEQMWIVTMEELQSIINSNLKKQPTFFNRLAEALNILDTFFHANEKGLPLDVIQANDLHREIKLLLKHHRCSTEDLIDRFFLARLDLQQRQDSREFGTLTVRAYYNLLAKLLIIEVKCAKNIIPLDSNGLSDPFVVLELVPPAVFPDQDPKKTKIIKKNLNPTFDESFEFSVTNSQCRHKSAMLQFTVMDHDFMFQNDFAGEAYLSLGSVPGLNGEKVGLAHLKNLQLTLIHPTDTDKEPTNPLFALENRSVWEKDAETFCRKNRERLTAS